MEVLAFPAAWIFCGIIAAVIASNKGRSGCGWFILGLLLGPFAFAVALLPSKKEPTQIEFKVSTESQPGPGMKKCPACAEFIKAEARKCRYCGEML